MQGGEERWWWSGRVKFGVEVVRWWSGESWTSVVKRVGVRFNEGEKNWVKMEPRHPVNNK